MTVDEILAALSDCSINHQLRSLLTDRLVERGDGLPTLLHALLHDRDLALREAAALVLERLVRQHVYWFRRQPNDLPSSMIPAMIQVLMDDEAVEVRRPLLRAFGKFRPEAVVSILLPVLASEHADVRRFVVNTLGKLPELDAEVTECLFRAIEDPNRAVRRRARSALDSLSWGGASQHERRRDRGTPPKLREAKPPNEALLTAALNHTSAAVRAWGAFRLSVVALNIPDTRARITKQLKDSASCVRRAAERALETMDDRRTQIDRYHRLAEPILCAGEYGAACEEIDRYFSTDFDERWAERRCSPKYLSSLIRAKYRYQRYCEGKSIRLSPRKMLRYLMRVAKRVSPEQTKRETGIGHLAELLSGSRSFSERDCEVLCQYFKCPPDSFVDLIADGSVTIDASTSRYGWTLSGDDCGMLSYGGVLPPIDIYPTPNSSGPTYRSVNSYPEPEQWKAFWAAIEQVNPWDWSGNFDRMLHGGLHWKLTLRRGNNDITCEGNNEPDMTPPRFIEFLKPLLKLCNEEAKGPFNLLNTIEHFAKIRAGDDK